MPISLSLSICVCVYIYICTNTLVDFSYTHIYMLLNELYTTHVCIYLRGCAPAAPSPLPPWSVCYHIWYMRHHCFAIPFSPMVRVRVGSPPSLVVRVVAYAEQLLQDESLSVRAVPVAPAPQESRRL